MICPNCGTDNRPGARFCAKCGAVLASETVAWTPPMEEPSFAAPPPPPPPAPMPVGPATPGTVEKRYPILRVLSVIYKVLGGIVAAFTLLGALASCIVGIAGGALLGDLGRELGVPMMDTGGIVGGIVGGLLVLLYGGFFAVTLFGAGEMVSLFISVEENLRSLAQR